MVCCMFMNSYPANTNTNLRRAPYAMAAAAAATDLSSSSAGSEQRRRTMHSLQTQHREHHRHRQRGQLLCSQSHQTSLAPSSSSSHYLDIERSNNSSHRIAGRRIMRHSHVILSSDYCNKSVRGTHVVFKMCLLLSLFITTIVAQELTTIPSPSQSVSPSISHSPLSPSSLSSSASGSPSLPSILSSTSGSPSLSTATTTSSSGSPSLTTAAITTATTGGPTRMALQSDRNFCGESLADAGTKCSAERHCPMGNNNECPDGLYCYTFTACNIVGLPTLVPTISPKPTLNPASSLPPSMGPIAKDDIRNFFFCGTTWGDASERCYKRCMSGLHSECESGEECFSNADCQELKGEEDVVEEEVVVEGEDSEELGTNSTLSPDASPTPTVLLLNGTIAPTNATYEPTASPIEKDDMRNFFFCGKDWSDASDRCYLQCFSGFHSECPEGEECFAQADCRGVKEAKTVAPTLISSAAPFSGTRSPTLSPMPTLSPTITMYPLVQVTISPELVPTDMPTTAFPTDVPTLTTCGGDPCPDPEQCRSIQNFCGVGETYCNDKSVWTVSCGTPTEPPMTGSPTTIWPSESPSISAAPTELGTHIPTSTTGENSLIPTENFSELSDETSSSSLSPSGTGSVMPNTSGESLMPSALSSETSLSPSSATLSPTSPTSSSPTYANVDEQIFEPDDPAGSFFCGKDWNQAITECPHRCPSGETTQCPDGMQCYAFTPCLAVGTNTAPSMKPTWEPTKHPILMQYWGAQNDANAEGTTDDDTTTAPSTSAPAVKPSNAPTQDKCRGFPCDYEGECRSSLGFCGTGVGYCNSVSSWVPECGGGMGLVRKPTASPNMGSTSAPAIAWEEWSSKGENDTASDASQSQSNNTYDPVVWENWGATGDQAKAAEEDQKYEWWATSSSSSMIRYCTIYFTAMLAISFMTLL